MSEPGLQQFGVDDADFPQARFLQAVCGSEGDL